MVLHDLYGKVKKTPIKKEQHLWKRSTGKPVLWWRRPKPWQGSHFAGSPGGGMGQYIDRYIYIYIKGERERYDDHSSPGLWSAGVLNHVCLGLEPSNGRERRCLRARGPLDHLYLRPLGRDVFIIQYTTINICMYIYVYIYKGRERDRYMMTTVRQASGQQAC